MRLKIKITLIVVAFTVAILALCTTPLRGQQAPPSNVTLLAAPTPPPVAGVSVSGTSSGNSGYCWWVVPIYPIGNGPISTPACLAGIAPLGNGSAAVRISWPTAPSATLYQVIRTPTSNFPPAGTSCFTTGPCLLGLVGAVATLSDTGIAGTTYTTATPASAVSYSLAIDNLTVALPVIRTTLGGTNFIQPQVTGTPTVGNCAKWNTATGVLEDSGGTCGGIAATVPIVSSTYAARGTCTSTNEGQTAIFSDSLIQSVCISATWINTFLGRRLTLPSIAGTWVNQGTSTITATGGVAVLTTQTGSGSNNIRAQVFTLPATPYTVTLLFSVSGFMQGYDTCGLYLRQSSDGKMILHTNSIREGGSGQITGYAVQKYTNATTFSANYGTSPWYGQTGSYPALSAVRISDDGVNRTYQVSGNGLNWQTVTTNGHTDFLTADQYGYGCDGHGTGDALTGLFYSISVQ